MTCRACKHCGQEPRNQEFVCRHPDAGVVGVYIPIATAPSGHCGPERPKFEQHPLRTPEGDPRPPAPEVLDEFLAAYEIPEEPEE